MNSINNKVISIIVKRWAIREFSNKGPRTYNIRIEVIKNIQIIYVKTSRDCELSEKDVRYSIFSVLPSCTR